MSLGLVIPVWNDQHTLDTLLRQVRDMAIFDQIIVVDDGSDTAITLPPIPDTQQILIRHDTPQGPGVARNRGLADVQTRHVLFFDSDDLLTPELPLLWRDLAGRAFDFCLFRHCDSRQAALGRWGLMPHDTALWHAAGMAGRALAPVNATARARLAQTANFPWNRIWRTDFLHAHDIRCSTTRLHEDIEPHWMGFLHAETLLASDRVVAVHHVAPGAGRATNQRNRDRLEVFKPLTRVLTQLETAPADRAALLPAFLRFCANLFDWIRGNLEQKWHDALASERRAFWSRAIPPGRFRSVIDADPALALRLSLQLHPGGAQAAC